MGRKSRKRVNSNVATEGIDITVVAEERQHGQAQEGQQPVDDDTVKLRRGRPKKSRGEKQELEAVAAAAAQDVSEKPEQANKELEATEEMQSLPSSGEQQVDKNQKRKVGRPKKLENDTEETKPEGRHGAANGGQQLTDRRRSGRIKAGGEQKPVSKSTTTTRLEKKDPRSPTPASKVAKKHYLSKVEVDGIDFQVGDDVYVKKSDVDVSESDNEVEDCRICGTTNEGTMLECDNCLAGFHLTCLSPPFETAPEGDWICPYCEKGESPPEPASSQRRHRSARERLLARDLWAARIERIWRERDGSWWFRAHWFLVPEETALGRQPNNGKRELFRSNRSDDNEMNSILRHCYVMSPKDYKNSAGEGDDVFFCEYEYNERWCKFKRIEYLHENVDTAEIFQVAAVSGDVRCALEVCRRSVEVAEAGLKIQSSSSASPASHDPSLNGVIATTPCWRGAVHVFVQVLLKDIQYS